MSHGLSPDSCVYIPGILLEKTGLRSVTIDFFYDTPALGQLVVVSECVCPGRELTLECTVVGGFGTLWTGTAFHCPGRGDQIDLSHARFESGKATGECEMITGRSLNRTFDSPNSNFTSQLTIPLPLLNDTSNTLDGRTVECARLSDSKDVVGNHTIAYTRASNGRSMLTMHDTIMIVQFMITLQLHLLITFT